MNILRAIRADRSKERRYADHIFTQIYFRMHHFVVKFSKKIRLRRQGGIDPPNQNPADPPASERFAAEIAAAAAVVGLQQQVRDWINGQALGHVTCRCFAGVISHIRPYDARSTHRLLVPLYR